MPGSAHQDDDPLSVAACCPVDMQTVSGGNLPQPTGRKGIGLSKRTGSLPALATLTHAGVLAASLCWGLEAHAADVDVAIAFAVDFSSSIDPKTAELQREGHAAALTSPEIIAAIGRNYFGCIGVTYFEWSSPGHSRTVLPWTTICGPEDAKAAATVIRTQAYTGYSRAGRRGTSVSSAIDIGALLLDQFPGNAAKKVIDISANGENNDGLPVEPSRLNALGKGYTINAIAIPAQQGSAEQPLASYFEQSVIGGYQAFVISPKEPADYVAALRRKLVIEVSMNLAVPVADSVRRPVAEEPGETGNQQAGLSLAPLLRGGLGTRLPEAWGPDATDALGLTIQRHINSN
ncbi:DUF1194 domain-containing protein [Mesorhizobium sp. B2-4-6]|uniref:DUF1194 domain-containing protein n=1 Tax=Mesorhizobium sp. B2-4-6 TaxID=2589943 RepID=UPI001125E4F5|nr:DUF1194 domain-containing protein [Mesorhizobium sp. B2-4-6]TPL36028.1 DUF1194 domain-containing protein [Mesorhizobium sp. B2-4-6]